VRGRPSTLRAIALFGAGAVGIHQLRYAIAYGDSAPTALAAHHTYFDFALPAVATIFVFALAAMLIRIARGRSAAPGRRTPFVLLWLCCALALGTIYGVQETLEGAGALAGGGWIGFALAFPAGLLVAVALRGAGAAEILMPAPSWRIHPLGAIRVGVRKASAQSRIFGGRLRARAPPLSFAG
jgi:hypothetical protein